MSDAGTGGAPGALDGELVLVGAGVDWLSVRWVEGFAPDAAGFRLRWRQVPAGENGVTWSGVDLAAEVREYRISGLKPGARYRLRLNALDGDLAPGALVAATFETLAPPVRGLVALPTLDGLRVGWNAPEGWVPAGYVLRWRVRGVEAFAGEVSLPAAARSHVVSGLSDAVEYVFRVNPLSSSGREGDPAKIGGTIAAGGVLMLTGAGVDWLSVRWAEGFAPDAAGFRLQWRIIPAPAGGPLVWSSVDLDAAAREHTIGGLAAATPYRLRLGALDGAGATAAAVVGRFETAPPPPTCADGAVGDTDADEALLVECNVQVGLVAALIGDGEATLNWDPTTDIADWDGVTVEGTPRRVVKLDLAHKGLAGELPARLVNLEELRELRVNDNSLGGRIPSELGLLRKLTHLYVAGNNFTGCYPPHWDDVANNDLAALGLRSCAIPYNLRSTTAVTAAGSYGLLSDADDPTSLFEPEHTTGEAQGVLVYDTDANGASLSAFYDTIRPGDVFDIAQGTRGVGCYRRFAVTEVVPEPAGAPNRTLFKTDYRGSEVWACDHSNPYNTPHPVEFYWHPVPWVWGSNEIREYVEEPVTGPGRYWMGSDVTIQIPDGVTLEIDGSSYVHGTWYLVLRDIASGARLGFNLDTGRDVGQEIPDGLSETEKAAIKALLDQLEASIETPNQSN